MRNVRLLLLVSAICGVISTGFLIKGMKDIQNEIIVLQEQIGATICLDTYDN